MLQGKQLLFPIPFRVRSGAMYPHVFTKVVSKPSKLIDILQFIEPGKIWRVRSTPRSQSLFWTPPRQA